MREIRITRGFTPSTPGSVLISAGKTIVLCTATTTDNIPQWLTGSGRGWVTAEYSMLPGSTHSRKPRERRVGRPDARAMEIQRLIGRCLRCVVDLHKLPEVSIWVDCDVLSADGGTRTLAITGAWIALHDLLKSMERKKRLTEWPLKDALAACSVGIVGGEPRLDLCYEEDSNADVDMNVAMTSSGNFAEVQASSERSQLPRKQLDAMLDLAEAGCRRLFAIQRDAIEAEPG